MKSAKIFVIDDNEDILKLLKFNFEKEKVAVRTFQSGEAALAQLTKEIPDLILCDWMLEDMDGLEICRHIKKSEAWEKIPFIMLSARNHEIDVVTALEVGADDYISKPVRIRELMVRVKKTIGKTKVDFSRQILINNQQKVGPSELVHKEIKLNKEKYQVFSNQSEILLTLTEFKLLELFLSQKGKVLSRGKIMDLIYGAEYGVTERAVDVLVVSLRKKIPILKKDLETVRGVGYKLRID